MILNTGKETERVDKIEKEKHTVWLFNDLLKVLKTLEIIRASSIPANPFKTFIIPDDRYSTVILNSFFSLIFPLK